MSIAEESCSLSRGPLWQKLPFLPEPPTPGFNPAEWSLAQFESYVKSTILQTTAVAIAFIGISFLLLLFLLLWRLLGWIKYCYLTCCGVAPRNTRRKSLLAYEVMHDPWLRGHKVVYAFFAAGCVVLAATGLATLPRPLKQAQDLSSRLEAASAFTSSLLSASDGLLGAAAKVRPVMSEVETALELEDLEQRLVNDIQCVSSLLDGGLALPGTLRSQIEAVTSAFSVGLNPALAAAAALMNATMLPAPYGATPSISVVAGLPALIAAVNSTLGSYESALAALPAFQAPVSVSDPRINALQTAQDALNISGWLFELDLLIGSLPTLEAAAFERLYEQAGTAVQALQAAAAAAEPALDTLIISLVSLDTLYLGPQQLLQQPSSTVAGRACILSLAQQLFDFDSSMFHFNTSLENSAIGTTLIVRGALEQVYGMRDDGAATGVAATEVKPHTLDIAAVNGSANSTTGGMQLPLPLASAPMLARQVLAELTSFNGSTFAARCNVLQSMLNNPMPDIGPLLSHLSVLRSALAALQQPSGGTQAALSAYKDLKSEILYGSLLTAASTTKSTLANACAAVRPSLPAGSYRLAQVANDTAVYAGSTYTTSVGRIQLSVSERMRIVALDISNITNWITASNGGGAVLNRTTTGLAVVQAALSQAQMLLNQSGWASASRPAVPAALTTPVSSSSPLPPVPPRPSAFLQPLLPSFKLIIDTVSDGLAAVADQLDNALGKALAASPSLPPLPPPPAGPSLPPGASLPPARSRRRLQQTPSVNVTTVARRQVVHQLDDLISTLRGKPVRRLLIAAYWSAVALYIIIIIVCLLLGVAMYFNFHAGLVVSLVAHLLLATVMLMCAWAAAGAMVVAHDACGNVDSLVLDAVSPSSPLFSLVRYYLQGVGGSLVSVLRVTGLGDTARLTAAVNALQAQVLNPLLLPQPPDPVAFRANSTAPWPGSLGSVQYSLGALLVNLAALASDVSAHLASLLTLGDRVVVLAQYGSVTSWACCGLGGQLLVAWVCATGCGLLACLAGLSGLMVLKNLDDMPVGSRCGCTCYDPRDFPKPVRRRRYSSSGGGFGSEGGAVRILPHSYPSAMFVFKPPPASHPFLVSSARKPPAFRSSDSRSSYGGGCGSRGGSAVVTATGTLDMKGPLPAPDGKALWSPEAVMESPLYQGPMPPPARVSSVGSHRSTYPGPPVGGGGSWPLGTLSTRRQPGAFMNVLVMDTDTARALGHGGSDHGSAGGAPSSMPSQRPSPCMSTRMSPSRPAPPPPAGSLCHYRIPDQEPQKTPHSGN